MSEWQREADETLMRNSFGPGTGTGIVFTTTFACTWGFGIRCCLL